MKIGFKNRYDDIYTFTTQEDGVLWEGDFKWCRFGWPNVYEEAYEAYCKDTYEPISLEEFKREVHHYDTFKGEKIAKKYAPLVRSDKNKIDMVDPSGGPYLCSGMDLGYISPKLKGMVIDSFVPNKEGYLIKIK